MNIEDVKTEKYPDNLLKDIFEKQNELVKKYHLIEGGNGLLQTTDFPVDLDDRFGQARLRDLAWRIVEELAEAMEYRLLNVAHYREELSDALHFYVELLLSAGIIHSNFDSLQEYFIGLEISTMIMSEGAWKIAEGLGLAMNCLKNKAWKQTHMETDKGKFRLLLIVGFEQFIEFLFEQEFTPFAIYDYYFRKNQVNHFRQRSQY